MVVPVGVVHTVGDACHGEILVGAQHLQRVVLVVGNGVVAHHLMGHRYGEQGGGHPAVVALHGVVEVFPVEPVFGLEVLLPSGVGKVERLGGCHGHEDLHQ